MSEQNIVWDLSLIQNTIIQGLVIPRIPQPWNSIKIMMRMRLFKQHNVILIDLYRSMSISLLP